MPLNCLPPFGIGWSRLSALFGRVGWGYGDGMYEAVAEICDFHGLDFQYSGDWKSGYQFKIVEKK